MKDGDKIMIYTKNNSSLIAGFDTSPTNTGGENGIRIQVRTKEQTYKFEIQKTDTFQKLFDGFCKHTNLDPKTVSFIFDGDELDLTLTPEDEDLDDDDLIDVKIS